MERDPQLPLQVMPEANSRVTITRAHRIDSERAERDIKEFVCIRDRVRSQIVPFRSDDGDALSELQARIASHHAKLVESIARRFRGANEPYEDLVQEGYLGLLSAMDHFSPEKKVLFSTYASHFIAGAMRHCLRDRGKIIKEPAWLSDLSRKIESVSETLSQTLGRTPDFTEIAVALNTTEDLVVECLASRPIFRASAFGLTQDDPDERVSDGVQAITGLVSESTSGHARQVEDRVVLEDAVVKLKELEKSVLLDFYYNDLNQAEIAKNHGISASYAAQILKNATGKLRRLLEETEVKERCRTSKESILDPQSGLFTTEHAMSRCNEEISRAARARQRLAVIVVSFKFTPQQPGAERNVIWSSAGSTIREAIRRVDSAGRLSGDRILIVLPGVGDDTSAVAERLKRDLISTLPTKHADDLIEMATAIYPDQGRTAAELIAATSRPAAEEITVAPQLSETKMDSTGGHICAIDSVPELPTLISDFALSARTPLSRAAIMPRKRSEIRANKLLVLNTK